MYYETTRGKRYHDVDDGQTTTVCGLATQADGLKAQKPTKKKHCGTCRVLDEKRRAKQIGASTQSPATPTMTDDSQAAAASTTATDVDLDQTHERPAAASAESAAA